MKKSPQVDILTPGQAEVLEFIEHFIESEMYPPTRQEIASHFGWTPNSAQCYLERLRDRGFLDFKPRTARSIVLLPAPRRAR